MKAKEVAAAHHAASGGRQGINVDLSKVTEADVSSRLSRGLSDGVLIRMTGLSNVRPWISRVSVPSLLAQTIPPPPVQSIDSHSTNARQQAARLYMSVVVRDG
jgi:hypothetical protein